MAAIQSPRRLQMRVPSTRMMRFVNPVVSAILRSPLHGLLSRSMLLLSVIGRTSGRHFTIPVGYTREGETLIIFSSHGWWKNLRGGAAVTLHLQGRWCVGRAEVIDAPAAIIAVVDQLVAQYGPAGAGRRLGLALDVDPAPSHDEIFQAMQGRALIRLSLAA